MGERLLLKTVLAGSERLEVSAGAGEEGSC